MHTNICTLPDSLRLRSTLPPPHLLDSCICWADLDGFSGQIPNQNHNSSPPSRLSIHRSCCRSQRSLIDEAAVEENCIRCLSSPMLGWWMGVASTLCMYMKTRFISWVTVSCPPYLPNSALATCFSFLSDMFLSAFILSTPHSPHLPSAALLHFLWHSLGAKRKKRQLSEVGTILIYVYGLWIFSINSCFGLFFCFAVKSHVCLLEREFIWYVGSLNNSAFPWH